VFSFNEYLSKIKRKLENIFGCSSKASGVLIHEKNQDKKSLRYTPFEYCL
jgi:hypothetical protein